MSDLEFIKEFQKIKLTDICKELKIDYSNLYAGRTGKTNEKRVKEELIKRYNKLLEGEENEEKI